MKLLADAMKVAFERHYRPNRTKGHGPFEGLIDEDQAHHAEDYFSAPEPDWDEIAAATLVRLTEIAKETYQ